MAETTHSGQGKEELCLVARKRLTLDGVIVILTFDTGYALVSTTLGILTVEGEDLRLEKSDVSSGCLVLTGRVDALVYSEERPSKKKGLFGRHA